MDRFRKWASILGVLLLGALVAIAQVVIPGKRESLAELAEAYRTDIPLAQASDETFRADELPLDEMATKPEPDAGDEPIRELASREIDAHEEVIQTLDDAESQLIEFASARGSAPTVVTSELQELTEAKRSLEAQQESLIQEINRLRRQVQQKSRSESTSEADALATAEQTRQLEREKQTLSQEVLKLREKASTDRGNLSLLADHILKLRNALKASQEQTRRASIELEAARGEAKGIESLNNVNVKLNDDLEAVKDQREKIVQQLDVTQKRAHELDSGFQDLRKRYDDLVREKAEGLKQLATNREETRNIAEDLDNTKRQLSKTIEDAKACDGSLQAKSTTAAKVPALEGKIKELQSALQAKEKENQKLSTDLRDKEELVANIPGLRKELLSSKNQLLLKERELSILGGAPSPPAVNTASMQTKQERMLEQTGRKAGEETLRGDIGSDVMVVEVIGSRVALRSGPSPDDSEVIAVGKGTRLTVEERAGDWYRVITPNSSRAYIRSDMVRIMSGSDGLADPPVRRMRVQAPQKKALKAISEDPSMEPFGDVSAPPRDKEERAFQQLRRGVGNPAKRAPEVIGE